VLALIEMLLVVIFVGLLAIGGWAMWKAIAAPAGTGAKALPPRRRAEVAASIAAARWVPGHDEVDRTTRILLRRTYTGLDGHPAVLEERVLQTFPADDPAWEVLSTEGMAAARFRCSYLNAEEWRE
jgi:hypothetical protein